MSAFYYIAYAIMLILRFHCSDSATDKCKVEEISTQPNFDIDKMLGKWYEVSWKMAWYEVDPDDKWTDYSQTFRYNTTTITIAHHGRSESGRCDTFEDSRKIPDRSEPAKWTANIYTGRGTQRYDQWIIATDYTHYAVQYGCDNRTAEGYCSSAHAWIFSRTMSLSKLYDDAIDTALKSVCLAKDDLTPTPQTQLCGADVSGGGVLVGQQGILLAALTVIWLLPSAGTEPRV